MTDKVEKLVEKHGIKKKLEEKIDEWIELLNLKLSRLPELPAQNLDQLDSFLNEIKCPLNDDRFRSEASFLFRPPVAVHVVGSYAFKCNAKTNENIYQIDLVLEIPKSCWQKKDISNFIYHRKRAYYLACVAKYLNDDDDFKNLARSIQFRNFNGQHLKPCLYVIPSGKLGMVCRFNILAAPSLGKSFVYKYFQSKKCNINESLWTPILEDTKYYNSSILDDLNLVRYAENLKERIGSWTGVQEALVLIRIFLEQRNLRNQFSHILTVFTCYLIRKRLINPNFTGLQIFEIILYQISISNWNSSPLMIDEPSEIEIDCQGDVKLIDNESGFNLGYNLLPGSYERLKYDCGHLVKLIETKNFDIEKILKDSIHPNFYFDFSFRIATDGLKINHLKNKSLYVQDGFNLMKAIIPELYDTIQLAVGDRLILVQPYHLTVPEPWNLNCKPNNNPPVYIAFGMIVDEEKFMDIITKGPAANISEAKRFRELWGEKSEIRRFQNGDICEAVLWKCNTVRDRRHIIIEALKYILNRRMGLKLSSIAWTFDFFDDLLEAKNLKFSDPNFHYGTGEECLSMINHSMIVLKKYLHNLELSFQLTEVVNVDPATRLTEVFPSLPMNSKPRNVKNSCNVFDLNILEDKVKHVKPINMVIKIDTDKKFSNDLEEIQNQKYLFHYELGKTLQKSHNLPIKIHPKQVDVYHDGFVFRLQIFTNKELTAYRQISAKSKTIDSDQFEFETLVLPPISSSLSSLAKSNPSFGLICRIFKRWLSHNMIKHFFNEITLDLLVANLYLQQDRPFPSTSSHLSGFLRLLEFIVNFDFVNDPIILNFNDSFTSERLASIRENFSKQRSNWPIIFIATPYDRRISQHTRYTPDARMVFRMKKLAQVALDDINKSLAPTRPVPIRSTWIKNHHIAMDMFDMVIKLNSKFLMNKHQSLNFPDGIVIKHTLYSNEDKHVMPIVDYNPASIYLLELKKSFKNIALFFYDEFGGLEIGVLLKPDALEPIPFKYSSVEASILTSIAHSLNTDNVSLNVPALVEDFKIMGQDLVERIDIRLDGKL